MKTFITTRYKDLVILLLLITGAGYITYDNIGPSYELDQPVWELTPESHQIIDAQALTSNYKAFTEFKLVDDRVVPIIVKEKLYTEVIKYVFYEIEDREQEIRISFSELSSFEFAIKIDYMQMFQIIRLAFIENTP